MFAMPLVTRAIIYATALAALAAFAAPHAPSLAHAALSQPTAIAAGRV